MKTLGVLLPDIFKDLGFGDKLKLFFIQRDWFDLFNEPISLHMYPVQLNEGELLINVDSNAWLSQIRFFCKNITERLLPYGVKSVRTKVGRIPKRDKRDKEEKDTDNNFSLSVNDQKWIDDLLSTINDPELRDNIKGALEKALIKQALTSR